MSADGFVVVIPARYASTRLPGKALADIGGKPMIAWVYEAARRSAASRVIVATDDDRIAGVCRTLEAEVVLTSPDHASGSDRIAEVAEHFGWDDEQIVVNVQGDEPLLPPELVDQVARLLAQDAAASIATLMTRVRNETEFRDPNMVKLAVDQDGYALYFSRAPIPYSKAAFPPDARRHIGLYAYRAGKLKTLAGAPVCAIEEQERLEQLRALWLGFKIAVAEAAVLPARGVDSEKDLEEIRALVAGRPSLSGNG